MDEWTVGPSLTQSVWRYKWLVAAIVLLGALSAYLWSATQPTRYEGVVRIFVTPDAEGDPGRIVTSHAQFLKSSTVSDRVIALTGNRLSRQELEKRLTVEPSANANFITIRTLDTSPENAAELADTVSLAYRQILGEQLQQAADQRIAVLEQLQERLTGELAETRKQLRANPDDPALQADEQAKIRQMEATASEMEQVSADIAGVATTAALQDRAAVPEEPAQPKPLRTAAIGLVLGLVIGVTLAWWLAGRQRDTSRDEETAHFLENVDDGLEQAIDVLQHLAEHPRPAEQPLDPAVDIERTGFEVDSHQQASRSRDAHSLEQALPPRDFEGPGSDADAHEQALRPADAGPDHFAGAVREVLDSLEKIHGRLYRQDFPQIAAERLRERLPFDHVAVLFTTEEGLNLAARVSPGVDEVSPAGHYDPGLLEKLLGKGARLIDSADRRDLLDAGIVGDDAQTIVVAPLEHEDVAFGALLAGQQKRDAEAPLSGNSGVDSLGWFARNVAPDLHAWLQLELLREQLRAS